MSRPTVEELRAIVDAVTREAIERGLIIEAGWCGFQAMVLPKGAPPAQQRDMRMAFFAGAQHLLGSLMSCLDPGAEPTDADHRRLHLVKSELDEFVRQFTGAPRPDA
jgi:hypothetical protein